MAEPYLREYSLVDYCTKLSTSAHEGVNRQTGEPYITHPLRVSKVMEDVLRDTEYREVGICAGLLHDVAEDVDEYEVYNPFSIDPYHLNGLKIYLNDLLLNAMSAGHHTCYILNKATFRQDSDYDEYMERIFDISPSAGIMRNLDITAAILKFGDRTDNTIPGEQLKVEELIEEYRQYRNADRNTLREFYKKRKVTDSFVGLGGIFYEECVYLDGMREKFENKKKANALDNLLSYIPKMEHLLVPSGSLAMEDERLYDREKLRALMKQCFLNSLEIIEPGDQYQALQLIHVLYKTGKYRSRKFSDDYISLIKELRLELRKCDT